MGLTRARQDRASPRFAGVVDGVACMAEDGMSRVVRPARVARRGPPLVSRHAQRGGLENGRSLSLTPVEEYVQPLKGVMRKSDGKLDIGALELGTDVTGMGGSGATGSSTTSAGVGGSGATGAGGAVAAVTGSGSAATGSGGAGGGATSGGESGGCGCEVAGHESGSGALGLVGLGLAMAALGRKRRQAR